MRKLSSILFLCLLLLNMAGYTFLTLWKHWETENSIDLNESIEIKGDSLIHKYRISLPYSNNFQQNSQAIRTAVFEGKFYQTHKVVYQNDTLSTYYVLVNYTRENLLAIAKDFSEGLTVDFSNPSEKSSDMDLAFFKKISKDYYSRDLVFRHWFWIDYLAQGYCYIGSTYQPPNFVTDHHPPIL